MTNFVLVHGVMHGGWFWEPVQTRLVTMGHHAVAPDLAGSGADPTPLDLVNLDMISRRIADVVIDAALDGPVVLVGHSFGGVVIGEVAERVPEHLLGLVYVTAVLAPHGMSLREALGSAEQPLPFTSLDSAVMRPDAEAAVRMFYNTCSPADAARAAARLVPQPIRPLLDAATVTDARFGRVTRAYVECLRDQAIAIDRQRRMQAALPCDPVFRLDCDHSPSISAPDRLAEILASVGETLAARGPADVPEIELEADEAVY